jgi:hypothetical protein
MTPQVSGFRSRGFPVRRCLIAQPVGWREGAILVAAAWLVPVLVHLIPWAGPRPIGAYLLPVFWPTFIAVYFYGALPGLAVGLVSPLVNLALTGLPSLSSVGLMGLEVALFVGFAAVLVTRWPAFWFAAPAAWLAGKAALIGGQALLAAGPAEPPLAHWLRSTENGLVGIGMLAVINWLLVAFCPRADA